MNFGETNIISTTIAAGLTTLVLFFYFLARRNGRVEKKAIPIAKGGWPLIGHLPLFSGTHGLPHVALGAMADECGPIFSVQLGMNPALVLNTRQIAEDCFTISDAAVSSRPKFTAAKHLSYNYAMIPLCPYGSYWREMRKITISELLSSHRIEQFKHVRCSEVATSLKELHKLWSEKKDASGHALVDMKEWFWNLPLNVMVRMIAGKRYSYSVGNNESENERTEARKWRKAMTEFFQLLGLSVVSDAYPFLEWLDIGGHVKAMKRTAKELDSILEEWLEEHRQRKASGNVNDQEDFMDVMLSVLDGKDEIGGYDAATVNKATCLTMVAGGSDTTSDTLTWALSLLLNHPHTLRQAQEEINSHIRGQESVNESDINELVYLQAIVKETLRLYPPATLIPRESNEDCTLGGYGIPKGTRLIVNVWKIHTDSRVWSDPFEFKPERFLTTHKNVDVRGKSFKLIPFGSGRRGCPGIVLGLHIVHLTLASLLHEFEISTPLNAPVDMTEKFGFTNTKATPLEVLIKPRLSLKFSK